MRQEKNQDQVIMYMDGFYFTCIFIVYYIYHLSSDRVFDVGLSKLSVENMYLQGWII